MPKYLDFPKQKMQIKDEKMGQAPPETVLVKDVLDRSVKSKIEMGYIIVDILNRLERLEDGMVKRKKE